MWVILIDDAVRAVEDITPGKQRWAAPIVKKCRPFGAEER